MITIKDKTIQLIAPKEFRNKIWAKYCGEFYNILKKKVPEINIIVIDLSKCSWIDPLPILSLLVCIKQFSLIKKENTIFILPKQEDESKQRLLKFLYSEDFLSLIYAMGVLKDITAETVKKQIKPEIEEFILNKEKLFIEEYEKIDLDLNYFDCSLFPATIFNLKDENRIDELVDYIMNSLIATLCNKKINERQLNNLSYKARIFINETLHNIFKHAYDPIDQPARYGGLYIRFRHGLENTSINSLQRQKLSNLLWKEKNLRLLDPFLLETREGCIEIFVVDSGKGISEALKLERGRDAFNSIFQYGLKSKPPKSANSTEFGGLYLIGQIFNFEQDFLLGKDNGDWVGGLFPEWKKSSFWLTTEAQKNGFKEVPGCIWYGRLSWKLLLNKQLDNWYYIEKTEIIKRILGIYEINEPNSKLLESLIFIDERFEEIFNIKSEIESKVKMKDCDLLIYLPQKFMTKHKLLTILDIIAINIGSIKSKTIVIADIPEEELLTYTASLKNVYLSSKKIILTKIDQIILISQRLSTTVFRTKNNTFKFESQEEIQILFNEGAKFNFYELLTFIITHDSLFFWNLLRKHPNKQLFINAEISWPTLSNKLAGYLNFPEVCNIEFLNKLFVISIERVLGLFSSFNPDLKNIDNLTENLVQLVKNFNDSYQAEKTHTLFIGSVYVTGSKERDSLMNFEKGKTTFHFFRHSSSRENILKLFYWAKEDWLNRYFPKQDQNFKRLGRTPNIAKDGWKSYLIPRYNSNEISIYHRNPKLSYQDWQSFEQGIIKIGNYYYGKFNDLFKLDIKKSLEYAFHFRTDLAIFLIKYFFIALGGRSKMNLKSNKREEYWPLIAYDIERIKSGDHIDAEFFKNISIIVYPNHFNTSFAIEKIKEVIDEDLTKKIFPLVPINKQGSNTSLLFSSLNHGVIKTFLNGKDALLFDDSIVNGRTRKEIKHLLFSLMANEVKTITIIDRQRLPYGIPNNNKHKAYWRFDIPRLGSIHSNPINRTLETVNDIKESLIETANHRISYWLKIWGAVNPFNDFSSHGLSPTPIKLENPIKQFSIKEDPLGSGNYRQIGELDPLTQKNKANHIHIKTSTGLSIYTIEISNLTGQNDLSLKYCLDSNNIITPPAKIEILASNLLLCDDLRNELRQEMISQLYFSANEIKYEDNHTALAAITLLSQDNSFIKNLLKEIETKSFGTNKNNYNINCNNIDLRIFLAIRSNLLPTSENFKHLRRLLKESVVRKEKDDRLWFNYELFEKRNSHISPINAVINEKGELKSRFSELRYSLEKLYDILLNFPEYAFDEIEKKNMLDILRGNIDLTLNFLQNYSPVNDLNLLKRNIEESLQFKISPILSKAHDNLFFKISNKDKSSRSIYDIINSILLGIEKNRWIDIAREKKISTFITDPLLVEFSPRAFANSRLLKNLEYSSWICFDIHIKKHLENLLINGLHCFPQKIPCPWDESLNDFAHLWINIEIDSFDKPNYLTILFANCVSPSEVDEVIRKARNSTKLEKYHCDQLGCKTSYDLSNDKSIIYARFVFPII